MTITEKLIQLNNERLNAITNLINKGVICSTDATFTELINLLDLASFIDPSDATATEEDIVIDKVGYSNTGRLVGTREVNGTCTILETLEKPWWKYGEYTYSIVGDISKYIIYVGDTTFYKTGGYALFESMSSLEVVGNIKLPISTSVAQIFQSATRIRKVGLIDADKATTCSRAFAFYGRPDSGYRNFKDFTDFKGFKNLGKGYPTSMSEHSSTGSLDLRNCPVLTHESLINIINQLYDLTSIGVNRQYLRLHTNCKAKLTKEEIAIATRKGWDVI